MQKQLVIAYFMHPQPQQIAAKTLVVEWEDRASVRDFARQSDEWLRRAVGNRVTTETMQLTILDDRSTQDHRFSEPATPVQPRHVQPSCPNNRI